jgi:hypothetical protein
MLILGTLAEFTTPTLNQVATSTKEMTQIGLLEDLPLNFLSSVAYVQILLLCTLWCMACLSIHQQAKNVCAGLDWQAMSTFDGTRQVFQVLDRMEATSGEWAINHFARIFFEIIHGVNACIVLSNTTSGSHDRSTIIYNLIFFSCAIFITFILGVIPTIIIPGYVSDSFLDILHKRLIALGWQSKPAKWNLPAEDGLLSEAKAISNAGLTRSLFESVPVRSAQGKLAKSTFSQSADSDRASIGHSREPSIVTHRISFEAGAQAAVSANECNRRAETELTRLSLFVGTAQGKFGIAVAGVVMTKSKAAVMATSAVTAVATLSRIYMDPGAGER